MILYVLLNRINNKFYIGTTEDIRRRLAEHNSNKKSYTGNNQGTWEMVYIREYLSKKEALKEEIRLKKAKNKRYIDWYIGARSSTGRASPS